MADINQKNNFLDDVALANRVNSSNASVNAEGTAASKTALETALSNSGLGLVARVITKTGSYVKIKFLKNGKKFGQYKSRNFLQDDAMTALEYQAHNGAPAVSTATSIAVTGTNSGTGAGTNQFTATLTRANSSTEDVTAKAFWSSATPAKATVAQTGLVTRVAAGTSVITATYAGLSGTRTMTVS